MLLVSHITCYHIELKKSGELSRGKRGILVSGSLTNKPLANRLLMKEIVHQLRPWKDFSVENKVLTN